jgi:osmotically-inducible protein OsmY
MSDSNKSSDNRDHTADTRNPDWDKYVPEGKGRTDEQIRADVHEALAGAGGADASGGATQSLSVSVQDGIVTLSGRLPGESAQQKVLEQVRAVPSVKEVRSQLQS